MNKIASTYLYLAAMVAYGWSLEGLLTSNTTLMMALKPTICCAIQAFGAQLPFDLFDLSDHGGFLCKDCSGCLRKRRQDDGSGRVDSQNKRRRVDGPGTPERPGLDDSGPVASGLSQLDALAVAAAQAGLEDYGARMDLSYSQPSFVQSSSSSMVQDMVNYDAAATSSLSTAVNNSSQGGLDARISVGQRELHLTATSHFDGCVFGSGNPLHLWLGDDVAGCAYEELFGDPVNLHLWEAQDLPNAPFELLQSDFDLEDGRTL